uniref:Uncharacterized protein n=1 Tax=Nelumbo nucifera TaxID=4432 RepID=A0A822XNS6_NELNU|nr:TPA_asm: hypothetical protein HUJ06_023523 [Nelumbo nucifera]
MLDEELKIRAELEMDIERDLEEEIKDGICRLALRLHRLYQHQMERNARETSPIPSGARVRSQVQNTIFSEVIINIRMEGGSKIEINEIKKEVGEKGRPKASKSKIVEDRQGKMGSCGKEFDWVRTLRSGTVVVPRNIYPGVKHENKRRSYTSRQPKGNVYVGTRKYEVA